MRLYIIYHNVYQMDYMNYTISLPYSRLYCKVLQTLEYTDYIEGIFYDADLDSKYFLKKFVIRDTELLHNIRGPARISIGYEAYEKWAEEIYSINGLIHNSQGPAKIFYSHYPHLRRNTERYYINGKVHRDNLPAVLLYRSIDGSLFSEIYYRNGEIDRERVIFQISYYINGNTHTEHYGNVGESHIQGGILMNTYNEDGQIRSRSYYKKYSENEYIRPAIIKKYENGELFRIEYFNIYGQLHRSRRPAVIEYDGDTVHKVFYQNGIINVDSTNSYYNKKPITLGDYIVQK